MKNKSVRISEIAEEFHLNKPFLEKLLVVSWGNFVTLPRVLTYYKHLKASDGLKLEFGKACGEKLRSTWIDGNADSLVDTLTLSAISTIARNAKEADEILKIILANDE